MIQGTWAELEPSLDAGTDALKVDDPEKWLIEQLKNRNFPKEGAIRQRPANTNILWSGVTQSGKSTSAAKLIVGFGDKSFLPSLKYHPAFTQDITTAPHCHLSVSPLPLITALDHDLEILDTGSLAPRWLPPGTWWMLDEPTDINSLDYWDVIVRAFTDLVTMYAFMGINLIVISPIVEAITGKLQKLVHLWIRQKKPGHSDVEAMIPWLQTRTKGRKKEFMNAVFRCSIDDEKVPPQEWLEAYPKIKIANARKKSKEWIGKLLKKGYIT